MFVTAIGQTVVRLDATDPVALASVDLEPGAPIEVGSVELTVRDAVPRGHKLALIDLPAGTEVRKYGQPIGLATRDIAAGEHVHDHNLRSLAREGAGHGPAGPGAAGAAASAASGASASGASASNSSASGTDPALAARTFDGIVRPDGRAGTRNYVAILSTVNCSATVVKRIAGAFSAPGVLEEYPGVDGVVAITHGTGCGLAADGEGLAQLRRTLAGYARHPNVGAVVLVGLGCEVNQISALTEDLALTDPLVIQELGGSAATSTTTPRRATGPAG